MDHTEALRKPKLREKMMPQLRAHTAFNERSKRRLSTVHTKKISDRTVAAGDNTPRYYALMARSFWLHSWMCRMSGCFFIVGLYGGRSQMSPRVVWKTPYVIYSGCCLALLLWVDSEELLAQIAEGALDKDLFNAGLWIFTHVLLLLRSTLNFLCLSCYSSKLLQFYKRTSDYEKHIGIPGCTLTSNRRLFWSDVQRASICIIYCIAMTITSPLHSRHKPTCDNATRLPLLIHFWTKKAVIMYIYFLYDSIYFVAMNSYSQVLQHYIENQQRVLEHCIYVKSLGVPANFDVSRRVESVRLNMYAIRQLKEDINRLWRWPLAVSGICVLLVPCSCLYQIWTDSSNWKTCFSLVLYAACLAYEFATLCFSSQSLFNSLKKMRSTCKTVRGIADASYRRQIELLYASIRPQDMTLKGGNFYEMKVSLLNTVTAAVLAYALILTQTNQSFGSRGKNAVTGLEEEAP